MKCPLCHKDLIKVEDEPLNKYDTVWECPTQVDTETVNDNVPYIQGKKAVHGHFDIDGDNLRAYYTQDYELIEMMDDDNKPNVFYLYRKDRKTKGWIHAQTIPVFEITSEEQMVRRIRTLLVFS